MLPNLYEIAKNLTEFIVFLLFQSQEDLEAAKRIFDEFNDDLHNELPNLYDKRIQIYSENFTKLCTSEVTFHTEAGKVSHSFYFYAFYLSNSFRKQKVTLGLPHSRK
jgi:hypothetical protein